MTTILSASIDWLKLLFKCLYSSVSSIKFYQGVLTYYTGYGIKYIITLCFFSSFICSAFFLNEAIKLKNYFNDNKMSKEAENIEYIINQLPEIDYNGSSISIKENTPLYINTIDNTKVLVLDPENKLNYNEKLQIPILLSSNKIVISFFNVQGSTKSSIPINYNQIFDDTEKVLTKEVIKSNLAAIFNKVPRLFIYVVFPILFLLILFNALLEKGFVIALLFLITYLLKVKASLEDCIRMILFASGIIIFLQPITILFLPELSNLLWIIQIWTNLLMAIGILKEAKRF